MADQCLEQHVEHNADGGWDNRSSCTRLRRHVGQARLAERTDSYDAQRAADHHDQNTGRWWDLDGCDRTADHAVKQASSP